MRGENRIEEGRGKDWYFLDRIEEGYIERKRSESNLKKTQ